MGKSKKRGGVKHKRKTINVDRSENSWKEPANLATSEKVNVDKILDKAEENIDEFNYEVAQKFCQRALELDPDNLRALELTSGLLLEIGDLGGVKDCLGRALYLSPSVGHSKYMTLGQLHDGLEALQYYEKGIELMNEELKTINQETAGAESQANSEEVRILRRELSVAYCTVAELFMTDCCFEEGAEAKCLDFLEKAVAVDVSNPEAYQTMGGFFLIKDEPERSKELMKKSLSLWLPQYQAVREGHLEPSDVVDVCPLNFPVRVSGVKMLLELEEYDDAGLILEGLVEEDDDNVEVWYLLGWMNFLKGDDFKTNARFYFNKCKQVADKVKCDDSEMMKHIDELMEELGKGIDDSDEDKENEAIEDDLDDVESSEDDERMMEH